MTRIYIVLSALLAFSAHIRGDGFCAGTLVKQPIGYQKIEQLEVGDIVVAYNFDGECISAPVTAIKKSHVQAYMQVWVEGTPICADLDHKFYLPQEKKWVKARGISRKAELLSNCIYLKRISHAVYIPVEQDVYDISVADYHNYCVSTKNIHVHNFLPIVLELTWVIGEGITYYLGTEIIKGVAVGVIQSAIDSSPRPTLQVDEERFARSMQYFAEVNKLAGSPEGPEDPQKPPKKDGGNTQGPQNPDDPENRPDDELFREIRKLGKKAAEHKEKLKEYINDPDKYDNQGRLKDAGDNIKRREDIISGRIDHLNDEIKAAQERIKRAQDILTKRGVQWD